MGELGEFKLKHGWDPWRSEGEDSHTEAISEGSMSSLSSSSLESDSDKEDAISKISAAIVDKPILTHVSSGLKRKVFFQDKLIQVKPKRQNNNVQLLVHQRLGQKIQPYL